jgi:hypothetical protein
MTDTREARSEIDTTATRDPEADYQRKKAEIRADASLSWEAKERQIRELGLEFDKARREREASDARTAA